MRNKRLRNITVSGFMVTLVMFFASGEAAADSRFFLIDGKDAGKMVRALYDNTTNYDFGIYTGGLFQKLLGPSGKSYFKFDGGDYPNFALDLGGGNYLSLQNDDGVVTYLPPLIPKENSRNPAFWTDYYSGAYITWNITSPNIVDVTMYNKNDGVYPIPIPTTLLLFGSGLVALLGLRKRNIIARISE
jgi:hypothetical protein